MKDKEQKILFNKFKEDHQKKDSTAFDIIQYVNQRYPEISTKAKSNISFVSWIGLFNYAHLKSEEFQLLINNNIEKFDGYVENLHKSIFDVKRKLEILNSNLMKFAYVDVMEVEIRLSNFLLLICNFNNLKLFDFYKNNTYMLNTFKRGKFLDYLLNDSDNEPIFKVNSQIINNMTFGNKINLLKNFNSQGFINLQNLVYVDFISMEKLQELPASENIDENFQDIFNRLLNYLWDTNELRNLISHNDLIAFNKSKISTISKFYSDSYNLTRDKTFIHNFRSLTNDINQFISINFVSIEGSVKNIFSSFYKTRLILEIKLMK